MVALIVMLTFLVTMLAKGSTPFLILFFDLLRGNVFSFLVYILGIFVLCFECTTFIVYIRSTTVLS